LLFLEVYTGFLTFQPESLIYQDPRGLVMRHLKAFHQRSIRRSADAEGIQRAADRRYLIPLYFLSSGMPSPGLQFTVFSYLT
jgi:hypothetical protein